MSILKVLAILFIIFVCNTESSDGARDDSLFLNFQIGAPRTEKLKVLIRNEKRELTDFKSSSNVEGVTLAAVCSLVICGAFFGGCLICPIWKPKKSYSPETSDVGNIDLNVIENKFTKSHDPTVVCNPIIDLDGAISKIIKENTIAHHNPCFSMDESSNSLNRSQSLPKVHGKNGDHKKGYDHHENVFNNWSQRQNKKSKTDLDYVIYQNKHSNGTISNETTSNFKKADKENKSYNVKTSSRFLAPSRLSVIKCSEDYNLFGFYNNTEYLNKNNCTDVLNRESHIHSRNHRRALNDLSNSKEVEFRQLHERNKNPKLIFSLTNTYECSIDPYPNDINDRFYDMNDVTMKNFFAK